MPRVRVFRFHEKWLVGVELSEMVILGIVLAVIAREKWQGSFVRTFIGHSSGERFDFSFSIIWRINSYCKRFAQSAEPGSEKA